MEEIPLGRPHAEVLQAVITADAVVGVNDVIPLLELRQGREQGAHILARPPPHPLAEDLLLGDHRQLFVRQTEAIGQLPEGDDEIPGAQALAGDRRVEIGMHPLGREQVDEPFGLTLLMADEQGAPARLAPLAQLPGQRREAAGLTQAAVDVAVAEDVEAVALSLLVQPQHVEGGKILAAAQGQFPLQLRRGQIELRRLDIGLLAAGQASHPLGDFGGELVAGLLHRRRIENHPASLGGVVEEAVEPVVNQGEQKLAAGGEQSLPRFFQHRLAQGAGQAEEIAALLEPPGEGRQKLAGQDHLPRRQEPQLLEFGGGGSLADGVERTQPLQAVAEKFEPHRLRQGGGEDVEDVAAQRESAAILHQRHGVVAEAQQQGGQLITGIIFPGAQTRAQRPQHFTGDDPLQERPRRRHHRPRPTFVQGRQGRQAARLDLRMGAQRLVGADLPVG